MQLTSENSAPLKSRPIIIGFGPAGIFAALSLIERGLTPIIFERGKNLKDRHSDVSQFINQRELYFDSNIQFGAGGAGTYSDGKLFSRINNSAVANKVLDTLITFGANPEIRHIRKPHLGTDVLRTIVANIENHIINHGGEIHYSSKMTDILLDDGVAQGVIINNKDEYTTSSIYLAVGNSPRDTFTLLHNKGIQLEAKPISVGVRIEHPASIINGIRYNEEELHNPALGAATYSFTYTNRGSGRGAYTFCMCPGGEVVNASSNHGFLALNGMSYSKRNSAFSNAAIVVTCHTSDYASSHPLAGVAFQKVIEEKAFIAGGKNWKAPAQNLIDFMHSKVSNELNPNSFKMTLESTDLHAIFPPFINETLYAAFNQWETEYPLFVSESALLMAPETRTSSPVRILRGKNYESLNTQNLYPIGEGSGYSGGIVSSAIDALKAVDAVLSTN